MRFAVITRHALTEEQHALANDQGIELIPIGDHDAFQITPAVLYGHPNGPFQGVVVVHPAAALRLAQNFLIGVFENEKRSEPGRPPEFKAKALMLFDFVD